MSDWRDEYVRKIEEKMESMDDHELAAMVASASEQGFHKDDSEIATAVRREIRMILRQRVNYRMGRAAFRALMSKLEREK